MLEHANDRFGKAETSLVAARLEGEELYDASLWLYGMAIDTLTRARGLHDWCIGRDKGVVALPDYLDTMVDWDHTSGVPVATDRPSQIADVLDAARMAANKGVHMFATMARGMPVWMTPGGIDPTRFGLLMWHRVDRLPDSLGIKDTDRAAYGRTLSDIKVAATLSMLVDHFRLWPVVRPLAVP